MTPAEGRAGRVENPHQGRVRLSGILDGSSAMALARRLGGVGDETLIDFSGVEGFEAFGVEVLLRELRQARRHHTRVCCLGVPPCLAARLEETGIPVVPSTRPPRWAREWAR